LVALEDAWEVANNQTVSREVCAGRRRGAPGDAVFYAAWQFTHKVVAISHRIEVVENFSPMIFNLRKQDIGARYVRTHSVLPRPLALELLVIAVCEEGVVISVKHWFQEMTGSIAVI
jgi:hypothetical protein